MVAEKAFRTTNPEGDRAVGGGGGDRSCGQGNGVAGGWRQRVAEGPEERSVNERAGEAHHREAQQLSRQPWRRGAEAAGGEPPYAAQILDRGGDDVDARVRIVRPVDRELMNAQAGALRAHEPLGGEGP